MRSLHRSIAALVLTSAVLFSLAAAAPAGPLRLVSTKVAGSRHDPFILVNISTGSDATQSDDPDGISFWIRKPVGASASSFIRNRAGTIAALNIRPATKWEMVYLMLSFESGKIIVLSDFNERLAKLCRRSGKKINSRRVCIEHIGGQVLTVTSKDYGVANYTLKVGTTPSGRLKLLRYEKNITRTGHP